jgi:hypothetical protein
MGYYIPCGGKNLGKVAWLVTNEGAAIVSKDEAKQALDAGLGVICVVDNGMFEAAAFCFNKSEWEAFNYEKDNRARVWLMMDRARAEELSGYNRRG